MLHKKLSRRTYKALAAVLVGLLLLAISAVSSRADVDGQLAKRVIELLPIPIGLAGLIFIYVRKKMAAVILAALGGLSFGNTSTIGRILTYPTPLWKVVEQPIFISLVASAILGQYLFAIALQRSSATQINAVMLGLETLGPTALGLAFFGDQIRPGFGLVVLLGTILVVFGSALAAMDTATQATV